MLSPLQPFRVRLQAPLSQLQGQTLRQCYQPIMGTEGFALYLSLTDLAGSEGAWSAPTMHASLLDQLQIQALALEKARHRLEGLSLLRVYQAKQVKGNQQPQLLSYELVAPLDVGDFLQHPLYAALLMSQIGDQAFYRLMRRFEWQEMDASEFIEVTKPFGQVFDYPADQLVRDVQNQDQLSGSYRQQGARLAFETGLEVDRDFKLQQVLETLKAGQLPSTLFTGELTQQILHLHQVYGFTEEQVASVIKRAFREDSQTLAMNQLPGLAQRYHQTLQGQQSAKQDLGQIQQQIQARAKSLIADGQHTEHQAQVIATAEALPPAAFLKQVKRSKGGLRSDQEAYNVKTALEKVDLPAPVVNLAIYYLLVLDGRDHLYKSQFEKVLDEWQQKGIKQVDQVFTYLEAKRQAQQEQAQRPKHQSYRSPVSVSPRQEVVPSWLKERQQGTKTHGHGSPQDQEQADLATTQTFVNPFSKNHPTSFQRASIKEE